MNVYALSGLINGLTASAVTSPGDWPAAMQVEQLRLQLDLLRQWGRRDTRGNSRSPSKQ